MLPSHYHSHFIKFYVQQQWCKACVQVCAKKTTMKMNLKSLALDSYQFVILVVYNSSALVGFKISPMLPRIHEQANESPLKCYSVSLTFHFWNISYGSRKVAYMSFYGWTLHHNALGSGLNVILWMNSPP